MTCIDDYLLPLSQGIWEVRIPKIDVSEPPGESWEKSVINVPTPGTLASYRKGQFHLHETETEYRVHLDRHDPKIHPILHLLDDAPLFLMISDTIITLFSETRRKSTTVSGKISEQNDHLLKTFLSGLFLILLGLSFIITPELMYISLLQIVIPLIVCIIGIGIIVKGIHGHWTKIQVNASIKQGLGLFIVGIILGSLPMGLWNLLLLGILFLWMMASSIILFKRLRGGKAAVPEGFISRLAIAAISLILATGILFFPRAIIDLLLVILGIVIILLGTALITAALDLRTRYTQETEN